MQTAEGTAGLEGGQLNGRGAEVQLDQGGNRHKDEQAEHADREDPGDHLAEAGDLGYGYELEYRLREKDILMEENRNLTRELKLLDLIIENFIPHDEVNQLNHKLQYDQDQDEWFVKDELPPNVPTHKQHYK